MATPATIASLLAALREEAQKSEHWRSNIQHHASGDILLHEHERNDTLHVILSGAVELRKLSTDGDGVTVDLLQPGALLGLISVSTGEPVMTTARAVKDVELLIIGRDELDSLGESDPAMKAVMDPLIIRNLAERYRRLVGSNLEIHRLAQALKSEKLQLAETISDLENTRMALISREKMATLGQLVAGVAHELNNPAASMQHSLEALGISLHATLHQVDPAWADIFEAGMSRNKLDSTHQRNRMEALVSAHPQIPRPLIRKLSLMPGDACGQLLEHTSNDLPALERALEIFESGNAVRGISVAANRIVRLVKSLKSHSRDGRDEWESADVADGIRDTLIVLAKPLRGINIETHLDGLPHIRCRPGALNQVWTNLVVNAAQAMNGDGTLRITAVTRGESLLVRIEDSGPGIPPAHMPNLFTTNFTTKSGTASFGLGLGLSIAREIVSQHNGTITAGKANSDLGGAAFEVELPAR